MKKKPATPSLPAEAIRFRVRRPEAIPQATILESVGFDDSWVQLL